MGVNFALHPLAVSLRLIPLHAQSLERAVWEKTGAGRRNGDGCPDFYWESECIELLKGMKKKNEASDVDSTAVSSSHEGGSNVAFGMNVAASSLGFGNNPIVVVDGLREVAGLVRVVCMLLTGILFVVVLNLFVLLIKH